MKKRFVILMVCLGIALCMSGCSEETDRSSPVSVGPNENAGGENSTLELIL